jgi:hypothetical protein
MEEKTMLETISKRNNRTTTWLLGGPLALLLAIAVPVFSRAEVVTQDHPGHASGQEIKIPQTAKDHYELAERYQKKAAEYRAEIDMHKKMLAEYSKGVAKNPKDTGENPYIKKMRLHCEKYIRAAENLEREAAEMAKFHTFRAKELEGK